MKRRIILAGLVSIAAIAINILWFSSVFDVRSIRVFGTHFTTRTQVLHLADITLGQPIARVNTRDVAANVGQLRQIESVEVRRGFPHSIVIEVHERVAIAAAEDSANGWFLVDKTGAMFERVKKAPKRLTAVYAYTERFRGIGARMAAEMPEWLRLRVKKVTVYAPEDIQLEMRNGKKVKWGGEGRGERKAAVLKVLLTVHARYYDVSAPDAPATRQ